jgi:tight adherence protein B
MDVFIFIGGGLAILLLIVGVVTSISTERSAVEERLGRYGAGEKNPKEKQRIEQAKETPLTDWINRRVSSSSFGDNISRQLAQADLKFKPGEYVATMIIAAFGVGAIAWYLGGMSIIVGIIGAAAGAFIPRFYVNRQKGKRLVKFDGQLADMLNLMVNGLRAGYSTMQAMEAVSKELPPPISDEFHRVVQEMQLGVPMERALDNLTRRIPSDDLDLVVTAINVQREVGGNLAEILDIISYTIRERVRIKGEIRVLVSQVSYSGRFLSLLPLILMGILYFLNRTYMMMFFIKASNTPLPCGYGALVLAAILIGAGYFAMQKLGDIEI